MSGYFTLRPMTLMLLIFTLLLLPAGLLGCGSTPVPTNTPVPPTPAPTLTPLPPTTAPASTAGEQGFQPLDASACSALSDSMERTLGANLKISTAPFQDYLSGESGTGCQGKAEGTGAEFGDLPDVASELQKMLEDQDWKLNVQYQADGPSGTAMGFNKDNGLCLLNINWAPSEDARCPDDQPIGACDLKPEQKQFTIVLNCARVGGP